MVLDSFRLAGRAALVTGAARGLGRAMAVALAQAGAYTGLLDLIPPEETAEEVKRVGRKCHCLLFILIAMDSAAAEKLIAESAGALGRLDTLISDAGIIPR